jgi:membrane protein implicated in regulation of membrane protease activity
VAAEGAATVVLDYQARASDSWWGRFFAACGLGLLVLACQLGSRCGVLLALFSRWPHVLGVIAGLAWWLWLWPSALGGLVILVSLACSLHSGWKWSKPRSNARRSSGGGTARRVH